MKRLLIIICLLFSYSLSACIVPEYGPEFDALILIEPNSKKNSYHLELPKRIKSSGTAKVYIAYMKKSNTDSGFKGADYMKRLYFWFNGETINRDIVVKDKEGYLPYIFVTWPRSPCSITAASDFLYNAN